MSAPLHVTTLKYPSPSVKKTGTTEQASLTNHKPEPHVRHRLSEYPTLAMPLTKSDLLNVSVSDWPPMFLACNWNAEKQRIS
uniref:Uncharacterized protein n=1 Tax=Mesocestoides corti TaxID=53468 RepID=A0A5K3EHC1_MESCO